MVDLEGLGNSLFQLGDERSVGDHPRFEGVADHSQDLFWLFDRGPCKRQRGSEGRSAPENRGPAHAATARCLPRPGSGWGTFESQPRATTTARRKGSTWERWRARMPRLRTVEKAMMNPTVKAALIRM